MRIRICSGDSRPQQFLLRRPGPSNVGCQLGCSVFAPGPAGSEHSAHAVACRYVGGKDSILGAATMDQAPPALSAVPTGASPGVLSRHMRKLRPGHVVERGIFRSEGEGEGSSSLPPPAVPRD